MEKFQATNFEYGIYTEIEGFIFEGLNPHVLIPLGKDQKASAFGCYEIERDSACIRNGYDKI